MRSPLVCPFAGLQSAAPAVSVPSHLKFRAYQLSFSSRQRHYHPFTPLFRTLAERTQKLVRRAWSENIQVVEERLGPADKTCHRCGKDRCLIREETSERLDLIPAQLIRRRTLRPIYVYNCGMD